MQATKELIDFFGNVGIFAECNKRELKDLLPYIKEVNAKKNTVLFGAANENSSLYIIASGEVEIIDNGLKTQTTLKAGDFFGETALFGEESYKYGKATIKEDGILYHIDRNTFDEVIKEKPHSACKFLFQVTRIIGLRQSQVNELLFSRN